MFRRRWITTRLGTRIVGMVGRFRMRLARRGFGDGMSGIEFQLFCDSVSPHIGFMSRCTVGIDRSLGEIVGASAG